MKNESLGIQYGSKKNKKQLIPFVVILIINTLFTLFSIYYFGYYKPYIITFNISINAYKSSILNTLLYANSYMVLTFSLIQTIFLLYNLIIIHKEKNNLNKKIKISNIFLMITSLITIVLVLNHILLEHLNRSADIVMTILYFGLMACLYTMLFSFLHELNNYFSKQNKMRYYLWLK